MQVPSFDLMSIRRRPLADISNATTKSENLRFKMIETEKKIAETMFSEAFKEKEVIRLHSIKTVDLLKIELKKSEEALTAAKITISKHCDTAGANARDSLINQQKIDDLMEEIIDLRTQLADATKIISQQKAKLEENEMLRASIAAGTAIIAEQKAKLEENEVLRASMDDATTIISQQKAKLEESEILRTSIADATAIIAQQKAKLEENETFTISIEEDVLELQSKSSLLASALAIAYDTISKQEEEIELNSKESILRTEKFDNLLDDNAQLQGKVNVLVSAADEHEMMIASMHREREEVTTKMLQLEKQLTDLKELYELEKAEAIVVPDELQISMNIISEISEDINLDNAQEVKSLTACLETLKWQNSKLIVENQDLSDSRKNIDDNYSHRINLLKEKLGSKFKELNAAKALQRTHDIDLEEVSSTMQFDIHMLTQKLTEIKKELGEKVNELTVQKVDDTRKDNELLALTEQLEESFDESMKSKAEIAALQRDRLLLEEKCNARNNTITVLEEENSIMSESKVAAEKEIDEVTVRYERMTEDILKLEEQAEEHSTSESRLENLLWNTREEHTAYMKLVKNLNNKILEKECETTKFLKNEIVLNDRLNTNSALITVLETKKARLSEDKKNLKIQLIESETASNLKNEEFAAENTAANISLSEKNCENAAFVSEISEKNREIEELKESVFQLEEQLVSEGELVATLEYQVQCNVRTFWCNVRTFWCCVRTFCCIN